MSNFNVNQPELIDLIAKKINEYGDNHPHAITCGAEYIAQMDEAQVDALDLVYDIFDIISNSIDTGNSKYVSQDGVG